jgi:hypothetical protein
VALADILLPFGLTNFTFSSFHPLTFYRGSYITKSHLLKKYPAKNGGCSFRPPFLNVWQQARKEKDPD